MISGDNRYVASHLAEAVGLGTPGVLTGDEIAKLPKEALLARVQECGIFAEIDPAQKERIIAAFRSLGHVVGYMGDGINDAPALHEADVGISLHEATDVAREAADMVLREQDLAVLLQGVDDGRATFANTMKYICITTSASFGNMVSMAVASLALPFLPLLAPQILLNNFLSDLPMLAIASDNVDEDAVQRPPRWNIGFVKRFMIAFGLVSSAFDAATFIFLMALAGGSAQFVQTGWFVESLLTELAIVLVVRTRGSLWRSSPGRPLAVITLSVAVIALAIPYLPGAHWLGFVPLPIPVMAGLASITAAYVLASDAAKRAFYLSEDRRLRRLRP